MKQIWGRIGMAVEVTDEQYEEIRKMALDKAKTERCGSDEYKDIEGYDFPEWLIKAFEENGKIDGEAYIPSSCWEF